MNSYFGINRGNGFDFTWLFLLSILPLAGSGDDAEDPGADQPARGEEESSGGSLGLSEHQWRQEDQDGRADFQLNDSFSWTFQVKVELYFSVKRSYVFIYSLRLIERGKVSQFSTFIVLQNKCLFICHILNNLQPSFLQPASTPRCSPYTSSSSLCTNPVMLKTKYMKPTTIIWSRRIYFIWHKKWHFVH